MTRRALHLSADGRLDAAALLGDARLRRVLNLLNRDGEETRIVGGAVRNALLGRPAGDIDLATTALPEVVMALAKRNRVRAVPTGIAHGTVTLLSGGLPVEVTTLREDVETDGRHAVVRFGRDFARDAERRDFTVNALSVGADAALHDTTGGVEDLAAGRIRFIGDAATRIREDYLRILRFFRFHATYGTGPLDAQGLAAALAGREGLDRLSRERVRAETLKLLAAPGAVPVLETIDRAGLLGQIIGGPADVGHMARLAEGDAGDPDAILRLAALAARTPEAVERLRAGLRLSNAERDRMLAAVAALESAAVAAVRHGGAAPDRGTCRALLFEHGSGAALDALRLARSEAPDGEALNRQAWDEALRFTGAAPVPALPFTGRDIVARGLKGPAVGDALARLRERFRAAGFPEGAEARAALLDAEVPSAPP